jgi:SAM-dependent methyltransferase
MPTKDHPYDLLIEKGHSEVNDTIVEFLSKRITGKFLDVGCNVGQLLELLPSGTGIDASSFVVEVAQSRGLNVIHGFAEDLPFKDHEFETVVLSSVLEQSPDWRKALREAIRVGRRVIGCTPYPGKSQWGVFGTNPWIKSIISPEDLGGARIEPLNDYLYYFEITKLDLPQQNTLKLLLGGVMLGDTFHCIPLINSLLSKGYDRIVWMAGSYMQPAVEFLQHFYPIDLIIRQEASIPDNIFSRINFKKNNLEEFEQLDAPGKFFGEYETFDWICSQPRARDLDLSLHNLHLLNLSPEDSIVVHPQTVHSWKGIEAVAQVDYSQFGLQVYTVGSPTEILIPNSIDFRGKPFFEVAQKIKASRVTIGIHSAISCLAFYLEHPAIACHPWYEETPSGFLTFSHFNPLMTDVVSPTIEKLTEVIKKKLGL